MHELASEIRNNLDTLADGYDLRLRDLPGYADMPAKERLEAARNALQLVAMGLESGDHAMFTQFVQAIAAERVAQGFEVKSVQQATTALVEIVEPLLTTVETASFLWKALVQANAALAEAAAEKMRIAEERFRRLAETTQDGVTIIEGDRIVYVNDRLGEILGYSADELAQMSSLDLAAPEEKERLQKSLAEVQQAGQTLKDLEFWAIRQDGSRCYLRNRYSLIRAGDDLSSRYVFTSDITERKRVDEALQESVARFQGFAESSDYGFGMADLKGNITYANSALSRMLGEENPDAVVGKPIPMYYSPEMQEKLIQQVLPTVMEQGQWQGELELLALDGRRVPTEENYFIVRDKQGNPSYLADILTDITARKQAEEARMRLANLYSRFSDLQTDLLSPAPLEDKLKQVTDWTVEHMGADFCRIWVIEKGDLCADCMHAQVMEGDRHICLDRERCLHLRSSSGRYTHIDGKVHRRVPFGAYKIGRVAGGEDDKFLTNDVPNDPRVHDREWARELGLASFAGYKLVTPEEGVLGVFALFNQQTISPEEDTLLASIASAISLTIRASALEGEQAQMAEARAEELRELAQRRAEEVQTSTEVAQEIAGAPALDELYKRVVTLVKERFGYYHTQIFRHDPEQNVMAVVEGYGQVGEKIKTAGHSLPYGTGVVGTAAASGQPVLAADVRQDPNWLPHPDLPETRGELAVPIILRRRARDGELRDEVLGVLDVQSDTAGALGENDQVLLLGLAGQIASAIDSTRLLQQTQEALAETERSQQAIREVTELQTAIVDYADYALISTTPEGIILTFNPAAERMLGYAAEELVNKESPAILHDLNEVIERARIFSEELGYPIEPGFEVFVSKSRQNLPNQHEWTYIRKDGSRLPVLLSVSALRDVEDNITGFLGIAQDITEQKRSEREMSETLHELERLYRTVSREGWEAFRQAAELPQGYLFDRLDAQPVSDLWLPEIGQAVGQDKLVRPAPPEPEAETDEPGAVVAPLSARGEIIGALGVYDDPDRPLSLEELALIEEVSEQVTLSLENARLFEQTQTALSETEKQAQRLALLNEMSEELSRADTVDAVLKVSAVKMSQIVPSDRASVAMLMPEGDKFEVLALQGEKGAVPVGAQLPVEGTAIGLALRENRLLITPDTRQGKLLDQIGMAQAGIFSIMNAPLIAGGRQIGVLNVGRAQANAYQQRDGDLLLQTASLLSSSIENRRLFEQTQQQLADLEVIQTTVAQLTAAPTFDEAVEALLPRVLSAVQANSVVMSLIEGERMTCVGMLPPDAREGWYIGRVDSLADFPMTKHIVETRQPQVGSTDDPEIQPHARASFEASGITSNATIPLVGRENVVGILSVNLKQPGRIFSEHDLSLLMTLADQATASLEKSRLLEDIRRRSIQLGAATEVSRAAASILDLDTLLEESVNLIRDQFDYYYAGMFLVDKEEGAALLRAGTGQAGRTMLEQGHRFDIGGQSMIGGCIADRQARIALDIGEEAIRFDNPLLPDTRSEMALPLISRGEVLGALSIQSVQEAAFSQEDIAVLQTMASQIATSIENARLLEQTQIRAEELAVLNELGQTLTAQLSVEEVLDEAYRQTSRLVDTSSFYIALYDQEKEEIRFVFDVTESEIDAAITVMPVTEGLAGYIIRNRTSVLLQDNVPERLEKLGVEVAGEESRSWLGVPMLIGDQVLGAMAVHSMTTPRLYGEHEHDLLTNIASTTAIAIQNARLLEEAQARADELAVLNELGQALTARLSVKDVLRETYYQASRLVDTTNFYIALYDPVRKEIRFAFDITESKADQEITAIPVSEGIAGYIIRNRTSVLFSDNVREQQEALGISMIGEESLSWLGVPLIIGDQMLGAMAVHTLTTPGLYTEHDRDLLTAIASTTAIAMQNARLFEQAQSRAEEQTTLAEMGRSLTAHLDVDQVLAEAYRGASRLLDISRFSISLYDEKQDILTIALHFENGETQWYAHTQRGDQGISGFIVRNREPVLIQENVLEWQRERGIEIAWLGDDTVPLCWMGVPLLMGDRVLGVIFAQSSTEARIYDEYDLNLMIAIASQASIAIQNARLLEEAQARAERERLARTISDRVRRGTDREAIMRTTLEELGQMLAASTAVVRLGTREQLLAHQDALPSELQEN